MTYTDMVRKILIDAGARGLKTRDIRSRLYTVYGIRDVGGRVNNCIMVLRNEGTLQKVNGLWTLYRDAD